MCIVPRMLCGLFKALVASEENSAGETEPLLAATTRLRRDTSLECTNLALYERQGRALARAEKAICASLWNAAFEAEQLKHTTLENTQWTMSKAAEASLASSVRNAMSEDPRSLLLTIAANSLIAALKEIEGRSKADSQFDLNDWPTIGSEDGQLYPPIAHTAMREHLLKEDVAALDAVTGTAEDVEAKRRPTGKQRSFGASLTVATTSSASGS